MYQHDLFPFLSCIIIFNIVFAQIDYELTV
jgi:hypothetical protein